MWYWNTEKEPSLRSGGGTSTDNTHYSYYTPLKHTSFLSKVAKDVCLFGVYGIFEENGRAGEGNIAPIA